MRVLLEDEPQRPGTDANSTLLTLLQSLSQKVTWYIHPMIRLQRKVRKVKPLMHHKWTVGWQRRAQHPVTLNLISDTPPVTQGMLLPFFVLENKLSQLQISQYQSTIMAVCNSGSYLIEEFGCLLFFKFLAGANKWMHVPIAPFKEHIRFCLPENYFSNLVDIFMCRQTKTWC